MNLMGVGLNLIYAIIGIFLGLIGMRIGYNMLDKLTKFSTTDQLENGNMAVGVTVAGVFVGIGICAGLVVGLALN